MRRRDTVCIVLIDAALLNGVAIDEEDALDASPLSLGVACCFGTSASFDEEALERRVQSELVRASRSKFLGHFVVLVGYDSMRQRIFYRNPASSKQLCFTTYICFEVARRSFGTDQDIIFIRTA